MLNVGARPYGLAMSRGGEPLGAAATKMMSDEAGQNSP
jgi:hypothetical protein